MSQAQAQTKSKWTLPTLGTAAWLGALLLLGFVLVGLLGPLILSDSPSAQDLDHLLEGPSRRHWLGTAGRRRALDVFSWESVAAQTVRVYEQAIARTGRRRPAQEAVDEPC